MAAVQKEAPSAFPELQAFYVSAGSSAKIAPGDTVVSAREEGRIVGVVRLAPEAGVLVLRGMTVANPRRGVGSELLRALEPIIGERDCYCLCPRRMEGFFGRIRFVRAAETAAPPHLKARWDHYHDDDQIIMMRPAA